MKKSRERVATAISSSINTITDMRLSMMGENDDILNIALEEKYRARTYTKSQESGPEHFVNNRSERPIISTKPVIASFDSEVPFTYVLVLQKTRLWHEDMKYTRKIVAIHKGILDSLNENGFDCVLFEKSEETDKYKKHGVILVGMRHSSEETLKTVHNRYRKNTSAHDEESDYVMSPADILRLTDSKIRTALEAYNVRLKGDDWAKSDRCFGKLRMEDLVPYDSRDARRSLVLDFFPIDVGDKVAKFELSRRFWIAIKASFSKPLNPYVFLNFCDNVQWLYGTNVAIYIYFALYTFQFLTILAFVSIIIFLICTIWAAIGQGDDEFELTAARVKYGLDGAFGIMTMLVWYPLWMRYWVRLYSVLNERWEIAKNKLSDGLDTNPKARFKLKYDPQIGAMVKHYTETWRLSLRVLLYPLYAALFLVNVMLFFYVGIFFASSMQLPQCDDCKAMMRYSDRAVFDADQAQGKLTPHPYVEWNPRLRDINITYEEYTAGWIGQTLYPELHEDAENITRGDCPFLFTQYVSDCYSTWPGFFPFLPLPFWRPTTCWSNEGLFLGSTLPAALYSIMLGGTLSNVVMWVSTKINELIVNGENWATITEANKALAQRNFFMSWIIAFAMNLIQVFLFVRFGRVIFHFAYKKCLDMGRRPSMVDYMAGIPAVWGWSGVSTAGFPPGIWDPGNELLDGEFIGLIFDFLLVKFIFNVLIALFTLVVRERKRFCTRWRRLRKFLSRCCRKNDTFGDEKVTPDGGNSSKKGESPRVETPLVLSESKRDEREEKFEDNSVTKFADDLEMGKAVGRISKFLNVCIVKMRVVNRNNYDIVSDAQSMLGSGNDSKSLSEDSPLLCQPPAAPRKIVSKTMLAVQQFTKAQINDFERAFNHIDVDGDGSISTAELSNLVSQMDEALSPDELKSLLSEMDCDSDGNLSFSEFLRMMAMITDDSAGAVLTSFELFDTNGDGLVNASELRATVTTVGRGKLTGEQADEIIREADLDGDGKLDYHEFVASMNNIHLPSYFHHFMPQKGWRVVSSLRQLNTVGKSKRRTIGGRTPGMINAANILMRMERGSFDLQVDFLDIIMRAAIVLFFSTFLPLISFFSLLFLFGEITLKVHQLLYYYQRPTPSLHHDTALLAWQMEMFMFLAIPFVVFYFLTVTLSMATCSHAEVRPMSFGSLGIYHCVDLTPDTETMELGDQMNPYKLLLGMMLIPTVLLNYRLIMHCVRPKPGCVRTLLALRVSRQQLNMENVKLTKLLSPTLRGQLSDLFDTMLRRQKVKKDLLRACLTAVHPGENDDGNAATRTTHLPPIGRVQNLRNAIRSSKDGGAGKSWPEVELAVRICDHPEAFSEELVKRKVSAMGLLSLFQDELASTAVENMASRLLSRDQNISDLEDLNLLVDRDARLAAIIREVLGKDTKTTDELDMLSRYLDVLGPSAMLSPKHTENCRKFIMVLSGETKVLPDAPTVDTSCIAVSKAIRDRNLNCLKVLRHAAQSVIGGDQMKWIPITEQELLAFMHDPQIGILPVSQLCNTEKDKHKLTMCVRYGLDPFLHYLKMPGDNPCVLGVGAPKAAPAIGRKRRSSFAIAKEAMGELVRKNSKAMTQLLRKVSGKKEEPAVRRVQTHEVPTGLVTMGQKRLWDFIHRETHHTDVKSLGFDIDSSGGITKTEFLQRFRDICNQKTVIVRRFGMDIETFQENVQTMWTSLCKKQNRV